MPMCSTTPCSPTPPLAFEHSAVPLLCELCELSTSICTVRYIFLVMPMVGLMKCQMQPSRYAANTVSKLLPYCHRMSPLGCYSMYR